MKPSPLPTNLVYLLITGLANFFVVLVFNAIVPLRFTEEGAKIVSELNRTSAIWSLPIAFLVPVVVSHIYIRPFVLATRTLGEGVLTPERALRRLLNAPIALGRISMIGWFIGWGSFFLNPQARQLPWSFILDLSLSSVLSAFLCFVLVYYSLEVLGRTYFIPAFFKNEAPSKVSKLLGVSLRNRFFIFFLATSIYPLAIFFGYFMRRYIHEVRTPELVVASLFIIFCILFGVGLTFLLTHMFRDPLMQMTRVAGKIRSGEYGDTIPVVSADEIGRLGETINLMSKGLVEKELIKDTFGKMVDPSVRDHLLKGDLKLGGELRETTILFTDIRNFTGLSEKLPPEKVVRWLNHLFEKIAAAVALEKGFINKYIGDAAMAVFGAPLDLSDHAERAVRAALGIRSAVAGLNAHLEKDGYPPFSIGIGIHTGTVLSGNIGSPLRMEYTVIGDTVNAASRVESLCKEYRCDLLFSEAVKDRLRPGHRPILVAETQIKGRVEKMKLFTL